MSIRQVDVQRFSINSPKSFEEVMASMDAAIGRPNMQQFREETSEAKSIQELEGIVSRAVGPSGLMEFARFDIGEVLRKERGRGAPRSIRILAGNPLIMKQMVKYVPDAASYAPITILVDERPDAVYLSYDRMVSFLASYGSDEALKVARDLDAKVEALLTSAAD